LQTIFSKYILNLSFSSFHILKKELGLFVYFSIAPEYEEAATALKAESIKLAKVDCTAETELCAEHEVKGYPTLKVFKDGKATEYNGGRKANLIINYMKK
jgi:hypothetical protein